MRDLLLHDNGVLRVFQTQCLSVYRTGMVHQGAYYQCAMVSYADLL